MRERTEQESLASLVGGSEDREPIDSGSMIFESLKQQMGPASDRFVAQVEKEESFNPTSLPVAYSNPVSQLSKTGSAKTSTPKAKEKPVKDVSTEKVLGSLYAVYDGLIDTFEKVGLESSAQESIITTINEVIACIRYIGGTVEDFDPYNHVSGLDMPDFYKNAQKVIDTTTQCYKKGTILEPNITDDGKTINIAFSGETSTDVYVAYGKITCNQWSGTEAIDYIYSTSGGKMSVKIFEGGKWTDCTVKGNYKIKYELEEISKNEIIKEENKNKEKDVIKKDVVEKVEKNIIVEKEVVSEVENNKEKELENLKKDIEEEVAEEADFPVTEK